MGNNRIRLNEAKYHEHLVRICMGDLSREVALKN